MEKVMWLVFGGVAFVAALRAGRSLRATYVGRWVLGLLFILFGAVVNAGAPLMLVALVLLLRAEQHPATTAHARIPTEKHHVPT